MSGHFVRTPADGLSETGRTDTGPPLGAVRPPSGEGFPDPPWHLSDADKAVIVEALVRIIVKSIRAEQQPERPEGRAA